MDNQNSSDPIYKVPPIDPSEPKKSWLSSHMILGVVFLIAALAAIVAGIYYWQTTSGIPSSFQAPIHKDSTQNWKTYTNTEYGFEFKYPSNWYLEYQDQNDNLTLNFITPHSTEKEGTLIIAPTGNYKIHPNYDFPCDVEENITFAGKKAKQCIHGAEFYFHKSIQIKDPVLNWSKDNIIDYDVIKFEGEDTFNLISTGNQILSTFKFTESLSTINSFASCAAAGYPIMESYPEQCRTPDGVTFVKQYNACIQMIQPAKNPKTGEVRDFPTPCDVPVGWEKVKN